MRDKRQHFNNDGMDPDWKPAETPSPVTHLREALQRARRYIENRGSFFSQSETLKMIDEALSFPSETVTPAQAELALIDRMRKWAYTIPRKPAEAAFTAGLERQIAYMIEDAEGRRSATGPQRELVEACRGLVQYWTRNLRNFQWEKADSHVKRINAALPEAPRE